MFALFSLPPSPSLSPPPVAVSRLTHSRVRVSERERLESKLRCKNCHISCRDRVCKERGSDHSLTHSPIRFPSIARRPFPSCCEWCMIHTRMLAWKAVQLLDSASSAPAREKLASLHHEFSLDRLVRGKQTHTGRLSGREARGEQQDTRPYVAGVNEGTRAGETRRLASGGERDSRWQTQPRLLSSNQWI